MGVFSFFTKRESDILYEIDFDKNEKIFTLYKSIYDYKIISDFLVKFDYLDRILNYSLPSMDKRHIYTKNWLVSEDNYVDFKEVNSIFNTLVKELEILKEIYDINKNDSDKIFNINFLKQYITNIESIIKVIGVQYERGRKESKR